jgi:predicted DNA-binding protein (UPF0251 family)
MAKTNRGSSNEDKGKSILSRKPQSSTFKAKTTDKKRSHRSVTSNEKLKAMELHQQGLNQREISIKLDIPKSTLFDIIKNKNTLLTRLVPANVKKFYRLYNELDMQVSTWVVEQATKRNHLNGVLIRERALTIHKRMVAEIKEKQNFAATSKSVSTPQKDAEFQAGAGSVDLKTELI